MTTGSAAIIERLEQFDSLVEVGVGSRHAIAEALATRGRAVTVTDIHARVVPSGVTFVRDDVTAPDLSLYRDADAIYALNLPPELHEPTRRVARRVDAEFCFTTLGGDPPAVAVTPEQVGETTLWWSNRYATPTGPGHCQ